MERGHEPAPGADVPIIDGHIDVLQKLLANEDDPVRAFLTGRASGHVDLPRALEGGMHSAFFAVYPPRDRQDTLDDEARVDRARARVDASIRLLARIEEGGRGTFRRITDIERLEDCLRSGRLGAILHFEGLDPIGSDIEMIEEYHRAGLRSAGLVWQRDNKLACAATSGPASSDCGLTPLGRRVVHECNRLGILIDLSHINEAGFKDVAGVSDAPLVATHSNAYVLSPHSRNLKDYQLDAIRDSGGIVGVTFCVLFLRDDLEPSSDTPVETIVRHIDYIASRIGFEHVGLGSDFDGTLVPNDIGDATGFPVVVEALRRHGLSEADLARATHGNWARVLRATWKTEPGTRAECLPRSSPAQAQASGEGMYNA